MRWEELTSLEFKKAVKNPGVCILPMGIIERHGSHLPVGTDMINVIATCNRAAELEPAVVFPPFYFGQIYEAKHHPGTIMLQPELLIPLLLNVIDEIGRNGFKKIIIVNGHGGNHALIPFISQSMLSREREYTLYHYDYYNEPEFKPYMKEIADSKTFDGHGGEMETSHTMANEPSWVKMKYEGDVKRSQIRLGRWKKIPKETSSPIWWYAYAPEHYEGLQTRKATAEKGRKFQEWCAKKTATFIKAVKKDKIAPKLTKEFYKRCKSKN
ncbi:MAG: hypothetical protein A2231_11770 [Candidatus Firestonebacteria bacterium RIFOXYA2_FULL_40_8]|nr:MAG: hypothetical protein A2231_11770 [Candidatus Firestonebacteria bacterium RIFOXYA2_FULL_40_8]